MRRPDRLLLFSQLSFGLFLVVCLLLMPHFLFGADEGGASNYGVYTRTIIPYTLAFGLCGLLMWRAAQTLPGHVAHRQSLQRSLYGIGALNLLVLESTYLYQVNNWLDAVHIYSGVALFVAEVVVGVWLWRTYAHDAMQTTFLCVELAGFGLLLLTFFGLLHVLFIAECVASLGFGVLLVQTVGHVLVANPST